MFCLDVHSAALEVSSETGHRLYTPIVSFRVSAYPFTNISGVHGAELFVIETWIRWDSVAISGNVTRPQHGTQQLGILIGACCYQQKGADTQRSRRRLLFTFHTMALGPSTPDPFGQEKFTELKYT